jgi:hypothetical protein
VDTVMIDGNIIMQDRNILAFDEQEVLLNAKRAAARLVTTS